jgi:plasmid stability protein
MPDVLVRNVPQPLLEALKERSVRHRRSLQQELVSILEAAVQEVPRRTAAEVAAAVRERLAHSDRTFGDSAALVREDRER